MLRPKYYNLLKCCTRSLNACYASKFVEKIKSGHVALIRETIDRDHQPTTKAWTDLRNNLLRMKVTENEIDEMILENCSPKQLDVGKSYVKYLEKSGLKPNTALMKLLKLYLDASKAGTEITNNDQRDIINMFNSCLRKFPILDSTLGEGLIYGILLTSDWRRCLEVLHLKDISKTSVFEAIIERAMQEQEESFVWKMFDEMVARKSLKDEAFISFIVFCKTNTDTFTERINKMLRFIHDNEILISDKVAFELQRAFQAFNYKYSVTSITKRGRCESCRNHLSSVHVTADEFNVLSNYFLDKILIGNNSSAEEVKSFITFIDRTKPYDYVIDGLNVAYDESRSRYSVESLSSVVKHYVDRRKRVLVIGRKHMTGWPKEQMDYIQRNSHLFLTDDLSKDDTFFLYATLKSGPNTGFVTRDLLHNYVSGLDNNFRRIFRKWQQQRQYLINYIHDDGRLSIEETIRFDTNSHQVNGRWHIPFDNKSQTKLQENYLFLHKNWLCLSKKFK